SRTGGGYPLGALVHGAFERQVDRDSGALAVVSEEESLTYAELERQANQLAHYLGRLGVGPETLVGLCLERSARAIVAELGILKSGGAYVPLDPSYPEERLLFLLEDTGLGVIVTTEGLSSRLPGTRATLVCL